MLGHSFGSQKVDVSDYYPHGYPYGYAHLHHTCTFSVIQSVDVGFSRSVGQLVTNTATSAQTTPMEAKKTQ